MICIAITGRFLRSFIKYIGVLRNRIRTYHTHYTGDNKWGNICLESCISLVDGWKHVLLNRTLSGKMTASIWTWGHEWESKNSFFQPPLSSSQLPETLPFFLFPHPCQSHMSSQCMTSFHPVPSPLYLGSTWCYILVFTRVFLRKQEGE